MLTHLIHILQILGIHSSPTHTAAFTIHCHLLQIQDIAFNHLLEITHRLFRRRLNHLFSQGRKGSDKLLKLIDKTLKGISQEERDQMWDACLDRQPA